MTEKISKPIVALWFWPRKKTKAWKRKTDLGSYQKSDTIRFL